MAKLTVLLQLYYLKHGQKERPLKLLLVIV